MSLYTMSFLGAAPVAALIGGWLADHTGVKAVTLGSAFMLAAVGLAGLSPLAQRQRGSSLAKTEAAG
jgi:nitrate/nitrite transporter NarK